MMAFRYHRVVSNRLRPAVFALAAAAAVGACSPGDPQEQAESYLASAREALENDRPSEAVIELKNAIQAKADFAPARLALGRLYVHQARYADAEKELRRALEHGAAEDVVWPALLETLIGQGKAPEALEGIAGLSEALARTPEILALHADALLVQGRREAARDLLGPADSVTDARLLARLARLAATEGDMDQARTLVARATAAEPPSERAFILQGILAGSDGDLETARTAFETAAQIDPYSIEAGLRLAQTFVAMGELDQADSVLEDYRQKLGERIPFANLAAMIALSRRDFETAKSTAERILGVAPRFRPALFVAGIANTMLGNDDTAISQLERFVSDEPVPAIAYKALTWANLRMDRPQEALRVLDRANLPASDLPALRLAVQAALRSDDVDRAKALLREAVQDSPDQAGAAASLAALQLASGEQEEAQRTLANLPDDLVLESAGDQARMALLQLRAGNIEQALALAEDLKMGDEPQAGFVIAGLAHAQAGRPEQAITQLEAALAEAPGNRLAALSLASLHQQRGETAKAETVLRSALEAAEEDTELLSGLVELLSVQGRSEAAESLLRGVVEDRPQDPAAHILLARLLLVSDRAEEALAPAETAARLAGERAAVEETLGRVHQALGNTEQARAAFAGLAELRPESADAHFLLARAQLEEGDTEAAIQGLRRVLEIAPGRNDARVVLARLLVLRQDYDAAAPLVSSLAEVAPDAIEVIALQGALARGRGEFARAAELYRRAWETQPQFEYLVALADGLWRDGQREQAIEALDSGLSEHEGEEPASAARFRLAEYYYRSDALAKAAEQYRLLVDAEPDNAILRNQLAWTLWESGALDQARPHAERALELAPESPEIKDTLAVILLDGGEAERALELLREAVEQREDSRQLELHLARALAATGRTAEARDILRILAAAEDFEQRDEAAALLEKLGS